MASPRRASTSARCSLATLLLVGLGAAGLACGDDGGTGGAGATGGSGGAGGDASGGGGEGGGVAPACDAGRGTLPAGLQTMSYAGAAFSSVRDQDFQIDVDGTTFVLNEEPLWESVRFELAHPSRIHGFSVTWTGLPEGLAPDTPLVAGLYADFGYNGFDFWAPEPLWSGPRCAVDAQAGRVDYVFDEPIEVAHPGLVYVAHLAQPGEPVFAFDEDVTGDGTCAAWDDCHSGMNLPEAKKATYYNGVSFPFPYDYLVELHVEPSSDLAPAERMFQPVDLEAHAHASFGDYDDDGDDDLFTDGPKLFRNDGGAFVDVTDASGIGALGIGATGGVFGDYDNDGCLDLFVFAESYTASDTLLRGACDGTFVDATLTAGITDVQTYEACGDAANNLRSPTAAAAWIDLDADGALDLYQANFICWSAYRYYVDTVWHNNGDGTFEEWTSQHGFSAAKTASRGAAPIDADRDGDVDLFVNNYVLQANLFFQNQGDGTVVEVAKSLGVAGRLEQGYYGHTIGAAWGDLDRDGDFDLVSANLAHPRFFDFSDKTEVLLQQSDGTFEDVAGAWQEPVSLAGLRYQETHSVPALGDFDQDGALDLVLTAVYPGRPTDFYWGQGDGTFALDAYRTGITTENGWGVALSDFDNDGDVDVFAHQPFVNTLAAGGIRPKGHYLQIKVVGDVQANRAAIGATVEVQAGGRSLLRHVQGGTGKGGQDSMYLHFGLGDETAVDAVSVTFPGGVQVDYAGPFDADQRLWVYESGGVVASIANPM